MEDVRVQLYYRDMGVFWKYAIQHTTREVMNELNRPGGNMRALELTPANWYGENLPEILKEPASA